MKIRMIPAAAALLLLCGCSHAAASSAPDSAAEISAGSGTAPAAETAPIPVAEPLGTDEASQEITMPPPAQPEHTPEEILEEYESEPNTFQGAIGGEEHGNTPLPEYFLYAFQPEVVTMKLAGGSYQKIAYDFSVMLEHDAFYFCKDYNEDGYFDLIVPVEYDGEYIKRCAVFCWNAETAKFETEPLDYECPPNFAPMKEHNNEDEHEE